MTEEQKIEVLAAFLVALDEWGSDSYVEEAKAILRFIEWGFDLSEYEDRCDV